MGDEEEDAAALAAVKTLDDVVGEIVAAIETADDRVEVAQAISLLARDAPNIARLLTDRMWVRSRFEN